MRANRLKHSKKSLATQAAIAQKPSRSPVSLPVDQNGVFELSYHKYTAALEERDATRAELLKFQDENTRLKQAILRLEKKLLQYSS